MPPKASCPFPKCLLYAAFFPTINFGLTASLLKRGFGENYKKVAALKENYPCKTSMPLKVQDQPTFYTSCQLSLISDH